MGAGVWVGAIAVADADPHAAKDKAARKTAGQHAAAGIWRIRCNDRNEGLPVL
jgi:hypothetical protein